MNAKTLMTTAVAMMLATALEAAVGVKNVTCQQRYPWNGKVDIDYEVTSDDPNADVWVYPTGYDKDANVSMAPRALTGEGAGAAVKPGKYRMTWDVSADYPDFASTAFSVKMIALTGGAPYMVIDLSGGVDALSYPVSYLSSVPAGGWSDEYKTTKLVLRLIPPGTFIMGSPSDEYGHEYGYDGAKETLHTVTITKPFFIGVFEVTQKQWELVMGTNPAAYKGDARPVETISYNTIRGDISGAAWPVHNQVDANSFIGRLRSKANMLFDLPTEAKWEYACRAGSGSGLNNGENVTSMEGSCANVAKVGRYSGNQNDGKGGFSQHTKVGMYLANNWGLHDMHGNVREICLDWYVSDLGSTPSTDPKGSISGTWRVCRGGSFCAVDYSHDGGPAHCRSAARSGGGCPHWSKYDLYPYTTYSTTGCRLCCDPSVD